ncbi:methyltransferase domain-containing protein [Nonomuraea sp. NPDC050691]|uniref:methyltransferase domain-containing protein n=1 Tax=Nonomuraea sp. NPDC050691 TaxID=3155661 RepID=UPI003403F8BD
MDIDPDNEDATLLADLAEPGSLPDGRYGCVLLIQTLQYVRDPRAALLNVRRALAHSGTSGCRTRRSAGPWSRRSSSRPPRPRPP